MMPSFWIQQPDGLWSQFSTVVDAFTYSDCTEDTVERLAREDAGRRAVGEVRRAIERVKETGRSFPSGAYSYEDCASMHREWEERNPDLAAIPPEEIP